MNLHLGCGKRDIPGFVNVDLGDFPHVHHRHDIGRLPMFADGSADLIYTSATFQYFDRREGEAALREWFRVLKPGGTLRLSTIDFDKLLEVYAKYGGDLDRLVGPLYGRMATHDAPGAPVIYHRTVYNRASLRALFDRVGFVNLRDYDWRRTVHRDHDDQSQSYVPHMDKERGIHLMQNVEADKPGTPGGGAR